MHPNHPVLTLEEPTRTRDRAVHRARRWSATMSARPGPSGLALAHGQPVPVGHPSTVAPLDRTEREAIEAAGLAPGATHARGAGLRARHEPPDPWRTCFDRDRDRILHASAFRRLAGKTQVFVFPADHQRTRLTHALEVAQVATAIARALRLNVALTEAIALAHDCGHGPGGHASEEAFSPFVGGYDHAVWGADVVLAPLNLCAETLDGVRNHSWSRPPPATPEGEVVAWADRIAYVCHDFEDAVSAGVVSDDDLPDLVAQVCGRRRSQQIDAFVRAVVDGTSQAGAVTMTEAPAAALAAFRAFDYERIYLRPDSLDQATRVIRLLRALVEHLATAPELAGGSDDPCRDAVTHVAGMTDRFACQQARQRLDFPESDLPLGVAAR